MGNALIDVGFSLLGLSYCLIYTYKVLKGYLLCTMNFKKFIFRKYW